VWQLQIQKNSSLIEKNVSKPLGYKVFSAGHRNVDWFEVEQLETNMQLNDYLNTQKMLL